MVRRRGFPQVRGQRRKYQWEEGPGGSTVTAFTSSTAIILGSGVEALQGGNTIVRIRGALQAYITSTDSINGGFHCVLGIGIVSADAFAVGVTAVPNPLGDFDWPGWMYHWFYDLHAATSTITDSLVNGLGSIQFEVDSKAMRKIGLNEVLMANLETVEDPASGMSVFFDSRVLLKLA